MINFGKYRSRLTGEGVGTERNDVQASRKMPAEGNLFEVLKFRLEKNIIMRSFKKLIFTYLQCWLLNRVCVLRFLQYGNGLEVRTLYAMHPHIHCAWQPETARTRYHIQLIFNKATDVEHFTMFMKKILYTRCIHWQNTGLFEARGQTEFLYLSCKNEEKMWKSGNRYRFMCLLFGN